MKTLIKFDCSKTNNRIVSDKLDIRRLLIPDVNLLDLYVTSSVRGKDLPLFNSFITSLAVYPNEKILTVIIQTYQDNKRDKFYFKPVDCPDCNSVIDDRVYYRFHRVDTGDSADIVWCPDTEDKGNDGNSDNDIWVFDNSKDILTFVNDVPGFYYNNIGTVIIKSDK